MNKCSNCDADKELLICDGCAADRYVETEFEPEPSAADELDDVLEFLAQLEIDRVRCGENLSLADVRDRLARGEHRR